MKRDKSKPDAKKPKKKTETPSNVVDLREQKRIAAVRDKLSDAMKDPTMRQQMVEAMRRMMREEK